MYRKHWNVSGPQEKSSRAGDPFATGRHALAQKVICPLPHNPKDISLKGNRGLRVLKVIQRTYRSPSDSKAVDGDEMLTIGQLAPFEFSRFAYWVFDIDNARVCWANEAALAVWRAQNIDELRDRDLGSDMSPSVSARLLQFQEKFWQGHIFDELWTIYPEGVPHPLICRFRGCLTEDGRMAMLCEAQSVDTQPVELVRGTQALLYTGALVSTYSKDGSCIYANPAARRAFGPGEIDIPRRILSSRIRRVLMDRTDEGQIEGRYLSEVKTLSGQRLHEIEVRLSYDAVTGERTLLLTEIDVTEKEQAKRQTAYVAEHDALTGLKNRAYLSAHANAFLAEARGRQERVFLCLLDLDRFKYINDTLGHPAGDKLLVEVARRLRRLLPSNAIIARLGGDEFCFLMRRKEAVRDVQKLCNRLLHAIESPARVMGKELRLSASLGLSQSDQDSASFDTMLQRADMALFDAKGRGGNRTCIFRKELAEKSKQFLQLDNEIRLGLQEDRFELYFQPRVSLSTNRIVGAETLVRLKTKDGKALYPDDFIPVAEATGSILALGRWVLRETARHFLLLRKQGYRIDLSANVSPNQFLDPNLIPLLRILVAPPEFEAGSFELEITENVLLEDDRRLQRVLKQVSELGVRLAIDDFGTAYSNIASLKRYPISVIKIDRSLVSNCDHEILTTGVITIAKALQTRIVAEGVETVSQRDWLANNGCHEYQGFLFSPPVPYDDLLRMLRDDASKSGTVPAATG